MGVMDAFKLKGRTALVTGSSRGIGRALALGLAECGANVVIHCSRPAEAAETAKAEAEALGVKAIAVAANLSEKDAPARLLEETTRELGPVDILIHNASIQIRRTWTEVTHDEFELQINVNLRAGLDLMQGAAPSMIERRWGRILTIGSVQQDLPHPEMVVYAATKSAQENMVRNLAKQLAPHGITVNNLAPGVITTDRNTEALSDESYREKVRDLIPSRTFGTSEDCVGAALLLCSDAGRYITGEDIRVDGGMGLP